MTREYRHGDPMRRVHWAATARHGELMVRQEESVTTPEATIILDQRLAAFPRAAHSHSHGSGIADADGHEISTSADFEWAVTAAMSICAHLSERNYALRFLDTDGEPAFLHSPSAPEPEAEEYIGSAGLQSVAESLAAIHLNRPLHSRRDPHAPSLRGTPAGTDSAKRPFDDRLMDKLAAHRLRGPVLAILGTVTPSEARDLAPAAGFGVNAFALVITEQSQETGEVLETLRLGGWRAIAVSASTAHTAAWSAFDEDEAVTPPRTTDVPPGVGVRS
jgi:hypothetical protein